MQKRRVVTYVIGFISIVLGLLSNFLTGIALEITGLIIFICLGYLAINIVILLWKISKESKESKQSTKEQQEEKEHMKLLFREQWSGVIAEFKEFFFMLKQKSFWKIFKDNLRLE